AEVGVVGTGGVASSLVPAIGLGGIASLGALFNDHLVVAGRLQVTNFGLFGSSGLGVALEYVTDAGWSFGSGFDVRFVGNFVVSDTPKAVVLQVPLRVLYQFGGRDEARRRGLALFLEFAPGYAPFIDGGLRFPRPVEPVPPLSLLGALGLSSVWN
ncbi:MAG: hypothetical protein SFW67_13380, partial [Myxococcaceae bacterium]|nr:hypothetical protein [Myxococcaceae bacterium]